MLNYNPILIYDENCQFIAPQTLFSTNIEKKLVVLEGKKVLQNQ